jgi:hypothetical protein
LKNGKELIFLVIFTIDKGYFGKCKKLFLPFLAMDKYFWTAQKVLCGPAPKKNSELMV